MVTGDITIEHFSAVSDVSGSFLCVGDLESCVCVGQVERVMMVSSAVVAGGERKGVVSGTIMRLV